MGGKLFSWRELGIVAAFQCALLAPFLGTAFHMDEPFFLELARHFLLDPSRPAEFLFNWYGRTAPVHTFSYYPSLLPVFEAGLLAIGARGEFALRAGFLVFDILAAASLYGLARRFLSRPLLPVLIALAGPAYFINMRHLMTEKCVGALGFSGLLLLVESIEREDSRLYWASALLLCAAAMVKYTCLFFLLPALVYSLARGIPRRRIAAYLACAVVPAGIYLAWGLANDRWSLAAVVDTQFGRGEGAGAWAARARAVLAGVGGGGLLTALWPFLGPRTWLKDRRIWAVIFATLVLFLPAFDKGTVRACDRILGLLFSAGAVLLWAQVLFLDRKRIRGWALWVPWASAVLFVQWTGPVMVASRLLLFLMPPLVFAAASALESRFSAPSLRRIHAGGLVAAISLTLCLAAVDARYSDAQRRFANELMGPYRSRGARVWFTGHWGLQHYLERIGAEPLDIAQGGWQAAKAGDLVVVPMVNTNRIKPAPGQRLQAYPPIQVQFPLPFRLMSAGKSQAGFYTSAMGFLPFSLSREPLDVFRVYKVL